MDFHVKLSQSQLQQLERRSNELDMSNEETLAVLVRTMLPDGTENPSLKMKGARVDDALHVLLHAVWHEDGSFTQLRLGNDPGEGAIRGLRKALRVLWHHFSKQDSLPFAIAHACAIIMLFVSEAVQNLHDNPEGVRASLVAQLEDIRVGAYELLSGPNAHLYPRPDLGES